MKKQSKLVSLSPFLDEDEIIRVGGRIGKADISFVARHPIVLDSSSELTKLIVLDTHHAGSWSCGSTQRTERIATAVLDSALQSYGQEGSPRLLVVQIASSCATPTKDG